MKKIELKNGFVITGFDFKDLQGKAREHAINSHYSFLAEIEMDKTSDLLPFDESEIIENIELNGYIFHLDGELLPMITYTDNHRHTGKQAITIFGKEWFCSVTDIKIEFK